MIVAVPVTREGRIERGWGRADRVAIADMSGDGIGSWEEFDVGWGSLHDSGPEGQHHARIARFLREHGVEAVLASHMGPPMQRMLGRMGIEVRLGATGHATEAVMSLLDRPD
jgi:predicted Fe-Mo cluster-binding NifX family protein